MFYITNMIYELNVVKMQQITSTILKFFRGYTLPQAPA